MVLYDAGDDVRHERGADHHYLDWSGQVDAGGNSGGG